MAALSQSCAFRQSTILSWHLPACCFLRIPGEKAGSLARWCVTTKVDVVPLRLSHASWWGGKKNPKPCLDTHSQINVRLMQQKAYVTQTCKKHMMDKEQQYKPFEAEIFGTCVQTGAKKKKKCCVHGRWHQLLTYSAAWSNPLKLTCAKSEPSQYLLTLQIRMGIRVHSHLHAHYLLSCFLRGISEDGLSRLRFSKWPGSFELTLNVTME